MIEISEEKLKQLVENFYDVCGLAEELDIYEWEEGDESLQEMEEWVDENFGRDLKNFK